MACGELHAPLGWAYILGFKTAAAAAAVKLTTGFGATTVALDAKWWWGRPYRHGTAHCFFGGSKNDVSHSITLPNGASRPLGIGGCHHRH